MLGWNGIQVMTTVFGAACFIVFAVPAMFTAFALVLSGRLDEAEDELAREAIRKAEEERAKQRKPYADQQPTPGLPGRRFIEIDFDRPTDELVREIEHAFGSHPAA